MNNRILLIDDDTLLGNILTTAFKEEGYEVHFQTSLAGLKSIIREFQPNIAILDVEIGEDDGIFSITQIQSIVPLLPIIIISSHTESQEVKRALKEGAVAYLKKPFTTEELLAYIERYIKPLNKSTIRLGKLTLNTTSNELIVGEEIIKKLTRLEYDILKVLTDNKGEVVTFEEFATLWEENMMNEHTLYNYISKLRKILKVDSSLSIDASRRGYMLSENNNI